MRSTSLSVSSILELSVHVAAARRTVLPALLVLAGAIAPVAVAVAADQPAPATESRAEDSQAAQAKAKKKAAKPDQESAAGETQAAATAGKFAEQVVVTATRTDRDIEKLPVSATVISSDEISASPALRLDDVLRSVVGINLPAGNGATQYPSRNTVSLRGMGGNRALVLLDGVPLNDPMFGHVDWNRIALDDIERVEVVRGGSASLFGSYAMGGTINILTRPVADGAITAGAFAGSYSTFGGRAAFGKAITDSFALGVNLEASRSDGYRRIPEEYRTPLDRASSWDRKSADVRGDFTLSPSVQGFVRGSYYSYDLSQGTPYSSTYQEDRDFAAALNASEVGGGLLGFSVFYTDVSFNTHNVRILDGGNSGYTSNVVRSPSTQLGMSMQWSRTLSDVFPQLVVGVDGRRIKADSLRDNLSQAGALTSTQESGGKQDSTGIFAQLSWKPADRFEVLAGARMDWWRNYAGYDMISTGSAQDFAGKSVTEFNPRVAARYELTNSVAVRGAVYRSFGAPRLSDLYRSSAFRAQENRPNPNLEPETTRGGDLGLEWSIPRFRAQLNVFSNTIDNIITSVIIADGSVRVFQPRNLGSARSRGVELFGEAYLDEHWSLTGGYAYTDAETTENPSDPSLVGKRIPEVARNAGTLGVALRPGGGSLVTVRGVFQGKMYADGANSLVYDAHTLVDLMGSVPLTSFLDGYVAVTNLLNTTYLDDLTSAIRRGAPREIRVGLRVRTAIPGTRAATNP